MSIFNRLFKPNSKIKPVDLTAIMRTEILEGFSIPGVIHNMQYHFTNLQVYSDGLVYCWGMVDLSMFKDKLNKNWVVTSIPNGEAISIFDLGHWYIDEGEWEHTNETLYEYVYSLVKRLNPTLENLHNYYGSDSKTVGKIQVAKHSIPDEKPYYYDDPNSFFSKKISGEKFNIFFRENDGKTYLAELSVYKSGHIEVTNLPSKKVFVFSDLAEIIKKRQIATDLNIGETVTILGLGSFKVKSGGGIDINLKLQEFEDKLNELNGTENSIAKCSRIFEEYKKNPTKRLKEELKEAYEAVPKHQRIFVGTMDTKDYEVRHVIYGDIVKKEFEDENGYEYPYDDMPKPIEE